MVQSPEDITGKIRKKKLFFSIVLLPFDPIILWEWFWAFYSILGTLIQKPFRTFACINLQMNVQCAMYSRIVNIFFSAMFSFRFHFDKLLSIFIYSICLGARDKSKTLAFLLSSGQNVYIVHSLIVVTSFSISVNIFLRFFFENVFSFAIMIRII